MQLHWAIDWYMEFNNTICHHLHIGKHENGLTYTKVNQEKECIIAKVDSEKGLGVIIDKT